MKKKFKLLIVTILMMSVMVGCKSTTKEITTSDSNTNPAQATDKTPTQVTIQEHEEVEVSADDINVMLTSDFAYMGLAKFEKNVDTGIINANNYNIIVEDSVDAVVEELKNNEIEFATLPVEVALQLYNSGDYDLQTLAIINTGGVYLVENGNTVKSMSNLADKTIYALGEYSSYELQLKFILEENGVDSDSITIEYIDSYVDAFDIDNAIVVMAEPFVSDFVENNGGKICLDFESEWNKIVEKAEIPAPFITSVIVSNTDFVESRTNIIREFLMYANTSVNALNLGFEEGNNILEDYGILDEAIENTNVTFIAGEDMVFFTGAYFFALEEMDGFEDIGDLPDDDFFFWE